MVNYKRYKSKKKKATYTPKHRINDQITAPRVMLIDEDGVPLGEKSLQDALARAEDAGLDLVEVAPNNDPPVCRIMDYGKFKYKEQKKLAESRKKKTEIVVKELRVTYRTDRGDLETKVRKAREFLNNRYKVKFTMRFRGREISHLDLGREKFEEITDMLKDIAEVEEVSPLQGNTIYVLFSPIQQ